ncbi:UNVERIFIED_CONTAM: hypothetical protein FKN15_018641 [Acipenser sinensis]
MNVIAVVISFLACDIAASSLLHCGLLLLPLTLDPFGAESLLCLWLVALVKLALLSLLSQAGRGSAVRGRAPLLYAAALCALTPALQTTTACLFWETALPCSAGTEAGGSSGEEKKQQARVLFMRVIGYSKPDAVLLGGAFLFLSLAVIFEMFIPFYTGKVIDILGSRYKQNAFSSAILFMGLFSLGSSLSAGLRGGLFMCSLSRLNKRVRVLLFRALVKQEIGFFETIKTGDITSRLSTDTTLMSQSVAMNMNVFLRSLMKTLAVLSLMVSLSWRLTLVTVIETLLISILQNIYNSYYQRLAKEVQDSIARSNEAAGEAVSAIKTVRSFATEDTEAKRYDSKLSDTQRLKNSRDTFRAAHLLLQRQTPLSKATYRD